MSVIKKLGWIDDDVSRCGVERSGKARCWPCNYWLDFGQIGEAESRNTDEMLTLKGQVAMAHGLSLHLKLKEIKPEWLTETAQTLPCPTPSWLAIKSPFTLLSGKTFSSGLKGVNV